MALPTPLILLLLYDTTYYIIIDSTVSHWKMYRRFNIIYIIIWQLRVKERVTIFAVKPKWNVTQNTRHGRKYYYYTYYIYSGYDTPPSRQSKHVVNSVVVFACTWYRNIRTNNICVCRLVEIFIILHILSFKKRVLIIILHFFYKRIQLL